MLRMVEKTRRLFHLMMQTVPGEDETLGDNTNEDQSAGDQPENPSEPEIIEGEVDVTTMIDTYTKDGEEQSYTISSEYVTVDDAQSCNPYA